VASASRSWATTLPTEDTPSVIDIATAAQSRSSGNLFVEALRRIALVASDNASLGTVAKVLVQGLALLLPSFVG